MKGLTIATILFSSLALSACQNADEPAVDSSAPVAGAVEPAPPAVAEPAPAQPAAPAGPQTTTQASLASDSQWAILFAGHDLSSFDTLGDAQWNIIDDYVEADGYTGSFLVSRGGYTNFRLSLEFWSGPDSNSGIFIRCEGPAAVSANSCYEINIFDTNENPDNRTGSIVNHAPPAITTMANEQWNTYDIVAQGSRIVVTLNGNVTAEIEDDSHPYGPFALQNNGGLIRFRNVRLRPL
ncbi:MAG: DUF1080 domain-containing protein [Candidatus Rariloculaceae bacterium]